MTGCAVLHTCELRVYLLPVALAHSLGAFRLTLAENSSGS
jgi:hypothetical protein